jgi:hypothetical protein
MVGAKAVRAGWLSLLALLLLACGPQSTAVQAAPAGPAPALSTPVSAPTTEPIPVPASTPTPAPTEASPPPGPAAPPAPPAPPPDSYFVNFGGLAPGIYPVHLHRVCNGGQGYHLAYLPYLSVSAAGSGGIAVPARDFGRGWCVIVYANRAATVVAAVRPI